MQIQSLQDLLQHELKDLYSAENQIIKSLPKMIKEASNDKLKQGLESHLEETREQATRLEEIADTPARR
jgi:ferritin-like metal-binding protein YciE